MLNDYMMYGNQDFFAIGGGQGSFGLWVHSDLTHGYSQPCPTFNNPMLGKSPSFECIGLEIWEFRFWNKVLYIAVTVMNEPIDVCAIYYMYFCHHFNHLLQNQEIPV